ncbi:glycine-rich RNA-binding protein 1-like [Setaria italica]|uniref:glycine-rich RNA-binding protein 1-like n=1 Tax=Setaria italica TaxID=4555 RepID=UPI00035109B1|nr:glycine-rich RNA-binding protein 1-like [Setaria italica]
MAAVAEAGTPTPADAMEESVATETGTSAREAMAEVALRRRWRCLLRRPDRGGDACLGGRDRGRGGHGDTRSGARVGGGGADGRACDSLDGGRGACAGTVGEPSGFQDGGARFDGGVRVGSRLCLGYSRSQGVERVRPALVIS